jgi:hypothetical protein
MQPPAAVAALPPAAVQQQPSIVQLVLPHLPFAWPGGGAGQQQLQAHTAVVGPQPPTAMIEELGITAAAATATVHLTIIATAEVVDIESGFNDVMMQP